MLRLTPESAVRIVEMRTAAEDGSGALLLRIWRDTDSREPGVRMGFVPRASDDDQLGESQGVAMCVGQEVADVLDGMVLDRRPDEPTALYIRAGA